MEAAQFRCFALLALRATDSVSAYSEESIVFLWDVVYIFFTTEFLDHYFISIANTRF